jgi:rod shape-determining protein MreC
MILMFRRPHYIALGLVVLLTLVILNLPSRATARFKLGIGSLFLPLFGLASSAQQLADTTGDAVLPRGELLKLVEGLRRENQQLRLQATRAQEVGSENARLRQLVGWQAQTAWKLKLGKVVLREPANWWRTVQIDLGSRDGLRVNLPVLTGDGLVGRIGSVSFTRSQVVLLGDPNCKVSARVENQNRDIGVIGASGPLQAEFVELGYLSRNADLRPAQIVVTSGVGGIFPPGIPIGKIVDAQPVDYGSRIEARVRLGANLSALEEVWVMFP